MGQVPSRLQHSGWFGGFDIPIPSATANGSRPKHSSWKKIRKPLFAGTLSFLLVFHTEHLRKEFLSTPGFWHMGFTPALGQQWCLSPGCCSDASPSAPSYKDTWSFPSKKRMRDSDPPSLSPCKEEKLKRSHSDSTTQRQFKYNLYYLYIFCHHICSFLQSITSQRPK